MAESSTTSAPAPSQALTSENTPLLAGESSTEQAGTEDPAADPRSSNDDPETAAPASHTLRRVKILTYISLISSLVTGVFLLATWILTLLAPYGNFYSYDTVNEIGGLAFLVS
jgi:hypothetical protein